MCVSIDGEQQANSPPAALPLELANGKSSPEALIVALGDTVKRCAQDDKARENRR